MIHYPTLKELKNGLGSEYSIRTIDLEKCLYRDFGNGFNVEISGCSDGRSKRKATLYLWFGDKRPDCLIVKTVHDVKRFVVSIESAVEELYKYSQSLIAQGYDNWDKLIQLKLKK